MRSSDIVNLVLHETFQMLPLEDNTAISHNSRRRTGQLYPGNVNRHLWTVMQSPSTRDGMMRNKIILNLSLTFEFFKLRHF